MTQTLRSLFVTPLAEAHLGDRKGFADLLDDLEQACLQTAEDDRAGRAWCRRNSYRGYTSYASLADLPTRTPNAPWPAHRPTSHTYRPHTHAPRWSPWPGGCGRR